MDLIVYDPEEQDREIARFPFPRQARGEHLCLSDYFRPVESGQKDVVAFQAVTVGREADELAEALQGRGDYGDMLYIHGLSVSLAEGMAEWTHRHIRRRTRHDRGAGETLQLGLSLLPGYRSAPHPLPPPPRRR